MGINVAKLSMKESKNEIERLKNKKKKKCRTKKMKSMQ